MYTLGGQLGDRTVRPGTNVLVTGPPMTGKRQLARRILERGVADGEAGIAISARDCADRMADLLEVPDDGGADRVGIVDCVTAHTGDAPTESETVKYAGSPTDVTDIGIKFAELIEHFHREKGLQRNRVVVDNVTTLLQYTTLQTVFRFLHATTTRTTEVDGIGVHVLESTVHDARTLRTISELFDGVVELHPESAPKVDLAADVTVEVAQS